MKNENLKKLVLASMYAAMSCAATMVIQIPSPMEGYLNAGDSIVLLGAWVLGPWYGAAAAGIGSMLADILSGYAYYAPATLIIKAAVACVAALLYALMRKMRGGTAVRCALSGIASETIMVLGYFGFASIFLGKGIAAAASIPGNCIQAAFGAVTASAVMCVVAARDKKQERNP